MQMKNTSDRVCVSLADVDQMPSGRPKYSSCESSNVRCSFREEGRGKGQEDALSHPDPVEFRIRRVNAERYACTSMRRVSSRAHEFQRRGARESTATEHSRHGIRVEWRDARVGRRRAGSKSERNTSPKMAVRQMSRTHVNPTAEVDKPVSRHVDKMSEPPPSPVTSRKFTDSSRREDR